MPTEKESHLARVESQPFTETAELPQQPTEDVRPLAPERLRHIAEQIVRNHEYNCDGTFIADAPYCSCAPDSHPLCKACGLLATSIEAALVYVIAKAEGR